MADADARGIPELLRLVDSARRARVRGVSQLLGRVDSERQTRAGAVSELLDRVDSTRRARREQCERLLLELTPQLEAARAEAQELDRKEAHRFNVFKYLATHELGLSRMIADLFDPTQDAEHGQGPVFLNAMLDTLSESGEKTRALVGTLRATAANPAKVATERRVPCGGLIDITVDIPTDKGPFCLAFENKPYADDGYRQLLKYLRDLDAQYGRRFLLVYVPPHYRDPDEHALPPEERRRWTDRRQFIVMPYIGGEVSIAGWFAKCRKRCKAEKLRLYLEDAQSFCREQFGGFTMTTDSETHFIRKLLSANPDQMHAALAVHDAWRAVRAEVCRRFLRSLHRKLEERLRTEFPAVGDLRVRWHYNGNKNNHCRLWISRDSWVRLVPASAITHGRTMIMLVNSGKAPNDWYWGVRNPKPKAEMEDDDRARIQALEAALRHQGLSLGGGSTGWWPQWEYLPRYRNWYPIAPDLAEENEVGGGTITDYYVDGLLRIARLAIPAVNELEAAGTAAAADEPVLGQEPVPADDAESPDPVDSDE